MLAFFWDPNEIDLIKRDVVTNKNMVFIPKKTEVFQGQEMPKKNKRVRSSR